MRLLPPCFLLACSDYAVELRGEKEEPEFDTGDEWKPPVETGDVVDSAPPVDTDACEPDDGPDAYTVGVDSTCEREPTVGSFDPTIEWQWNTNGTYPGYDDIMSSPAIANLNDDDGNGGVDDDDVPDIVFTSFSGGAYTSAGTVTAISGNGGAQHWSVMPGTYSSAGVALGDLDGNGTVEVCSGGTSASVVCLNGADGSTLWSAGTEPSYVGCPAIADLDGDGCAEVIMGRQVFDCAGNLRFAGGYGQGGSQQMSFAVNMDSDAELEVVAGNTVYDTDGSVLWYNGQADGMPAVGDFDGDGRAEVVTVSGGVVRLVGNDGTLWWATSLPSGNGGPPTVADFDGDGAPEVGVAGASDYSVYDTDGTRLWSMPVSDYSSNVTGSAVFDFEGDGAAEVVYADEHTLWVYDGATGGVEMEETGHASGTLYEYPLVADVDNDGSTEIILASNNYGYSGWNGITVFGDLTSDWAPARPVWNQFAYHITNVNNDSSIPAVQTENWLTWNNFRAGGTEEGPANWLPDLGLGEVTVCLDDCDSSDTLELYATVENTGLLDVASFDLVFYRGDGTVTRTETAGPVASGQALVVGPIAFTSAEWQPGVMTLVVDGAGAVDECDEGNNQREVSSWPCP